MKDPDGMDFPAKTNRQSTSGLSCNATEQSVQPTAQDNELLGPASTGESAMNHQEMDQSDIEALSDTDQGMNTTDTWRLPLGNRPNVIKFSKNVGVNPNFAALMQESDPGNFFFSLVDEDFFAYVADQTNLYATQTICKKADTGSRSRLHEWTPTDKFEIKRFFGLVSYMGIVKMPKMSCYWSKEKMFQIAIPTETMSRNRFEILLRMVHFADNEENTKNDRLHKVQPVLDKIQKNIHSIYEPSETVCVDESLIPFRGRLVMRQYIKNKRHRYGIKLFKLCSSGGFTYSTIIYAGKNLEHEKTTPYSVVMNLCKPILNCGRTVITDNWYTSVELATNLLNNQTHLVGTVRKNRKGLPKDVVEKKLKANEHIIRENSRGISILKWHDKRDILLLSTKHSDVIVPTKNRRGTIKHKPAMVVDYNAGKSAVDLSDQMTAYQSPLRKSVKWYRKLAFELVLNTALVNSWILYKEVTNDNISIFEFRKRVTYKLCESFPEENIDSEVKKIRRRHEIGTHPYNKRRPCTKCYQKVKAESGWKKARNLGKVRTYCPACPDEPVLCLPCFNGVHRV